MAIDKDYLLHGYDDLKAGELYIKWSADNPGEASQLDAYIKDIADDGKATPPTLATSTGKAFVEWVSMFDVEVDTTPPPPAFTVTSSLTGATLTAPVKWSAVPSQAVASIDFLIDGIQKWTEKISPYEYNGDGGTLDPKTLPNGAHTFTVVATTAAGAKATTTVTCTVDIATPPPPPVGVGEGRVNFWMYGTSQIDYVVNDVSKQPWMVSKYQRLEGWLDSESKWHPGVMRYNDSIAIYTSSSTATQHPDWILRDTAGNMLKFYSAVQYLADPGNTAYQDFKANEIVALVAKGAKGCKMDDVNLDKVSNSSAVNPRTKKVYTLPEWQKDMADLMTKIRQKVKAVKADFEIAHNALYWASGADVDRQIQQCDLYQLERGFNDPNFNAASIVRVWAFVDKLHSMGKGAIHLSEIGGTQAAHFNLACALLCSNGKDYVYGVGWRPEAYDPIYDTNLGDAKGPRYLVSGSLYRRDFTKGYATADLSSKVGTVVKTA